jgi:hypothetical protein
MEPVSGFEPLTCRLQEACSPSLESATCTDATRECHYCPQDAEIFRFPFHDPFHGCLLAQADVPAPATLTFRS